MTGVSMGEIAYNDLFKPPVVTDTVTITTQPQDVDCYVGGSATLSIVAESNDETAILSYQWQVYDGEEWDDIVGASSSTYSAPTSTVGVNTYRVLIASSLSGTATSDSATVTVSADTVSIITNPGDTQVYLNEGASVACEASSNAQGATLSYQWQIYNAFDEDYEDISGATSATYSGIDTSSTGYQTFRCVVTSSYGGTATTTAATVTVAQRDTITITAQPTTTTGYVGDTITLSVTAVSDNPSATLSYQWQVKNGATYDDISGATSSTYTVPTSTAGTERYRVVVSSNKGATDVTSNYADVTLSYQPVILYNHYTNPGYLSAGYNATKGSIEKATDIFDAGIYYLIPTTNGYYLAKEDNSTLVYMYNDTTLGSGNGVNFTSDITNADVLVLGKDGNYDTLTKYGETKFFGWSGAGSGYRYYTSNQGTNYRFTISPDVAPTTYYEADFSEDTDGWGPSGESTVSHQDYGGYGYVYVTNLNNSWDGTSLPYNVTQAIPLNTPLKFTWIIGGTNTTCNLVAQGTPDTTIATNMTVGQSASATVTLSTQPTNIYIGAGSSLNNFEVYEFKIEYIPTT